MDYRTKTATALYGFYLFIAALVGLSIYTKVMSYERERKLRQHEAYLKCLETGERPVICSFNVVFKKELSNVNE